METEENTLPVNAGETEAPIVEAAAEARPEADQTKEKQNHVFPEIVRQLEARVVELETRVSITFIEHPIADGRVFDGIYGGYPTKKAKKARARLSDGSWIDI